MSDLVDLFARSQKEFDARVAGVRDDQWHAPTPCSEWDLRALVHHVVYENRWVPPMMRGMTIDEVGDRFDGDLLGDDPKAAWDEAYRDAYAAVEREGVGDRTVHASFGDISATEYISQLLIEHVVHGWDVARAVGGDETFDPELIDFVYEVGGPMAESFRDAGVFGPVVEVPDDADVQTRALALFGRKS